MNPRILILYGGTSPERDVSLQSGKNVYDAAVALGYDVMLEDTAREGFSLDEALDSADQVIIMLHGVGGEDGVLQAELEQRGVPYLGPTSQACKITFDKQACKQALLEHGILVPPGGVVTEDEYRQSTLRSQAHVLKPITGGSSIDTFIITDPTQMLLSDQQISGVFERNEQMLLEKLIHGTEVTVGILDDKPLPIIMIKPPDGETFDYHNKYNGKTQELADPEHLSPELKLAVQQLALKAHKATGCRQVSRTDIIIGTDDNLYVLEINTVFGMTTQSLYPKAAQAAGIDYQELVKTFVRMSSSMPI